MEWATTVDRKYRIESLSAGTFQGALTAIKESLFQDEPVCICTELYKNETAVEELLELCAIVALDGVSLVAVHVATGEVAAAVFNKLQVATTDESEKPFFEVFAVERCTQPSSREIMKYMIDFDTRCDFFGKLGLDCSLEMMFLATLRHHRYKKLGTLLLKTSIDVARKLKNGPVSTFAVKDLGQKYAFIPDRKPIRNIPKFCQALFTGEGSQKIGKALGFTTLLRVFYTEFTYKGKTYAEILGADLWCEASALLVNEDLIDPRLKTQSTTKHVEKIAHVTG